MIDAAKIARENGMGTRTNTVLQTAFFKLSGIKLAKADGTELDPIQVLKDYAEKAYAKKGQEVVEMNWKCIEAASAAIEEVKYPAAPAGKLKMPATVAADAPGFIKNVTAKMIAQKGDSLKVSELPEDGTWPTRRRSGRSATSRPSSPNGILRSASSAASAPSSARTRRSA